MTSAAVNQSHKFSQYCWRAASAATASVVLNCPYGVIGGLFFGISQYFAINTLRTWSYYPNIEDRKLDLAEEINQYVVKILISHAATWAAMSAFGFSWSVSQIFFVSALHQLMGLLFAHFVWGTLHLAHVNLLKAVGS